MKVACVFQEMILIVIQFQRLSRLRWFLMVIQYSSRRIYAVIDNGAILVVYSKSIIGRGLYLGVV